jgi:FkbM family methyltransferase
MRRPEKLLRLMRTGSYRRALLNHRVAAAVEHEAALKSIQFRTVVDVGANRGQFALVALELFPQAHIVSLEPLAGPSSTYAEVFDGDPRVTLHRVALGPESRTSVMHVSRQDDSSSLLPITSTQSTIFTGTEEVGTETVRIVALRSILTAQQIASPALLKLDVQGFEIEALKGCDDLLDCFDTICAEGSFVELYEGQALADELIAHLRGRGFSLDRMYGTISDRGGRAIQADMVFRRTDSRRSAPDHG